MWRGPILEQPHGAQRLDRGARAGEEDLGEVPAVVLGAGGVEPSFPDRLHRGVGLRPVGESALTQQHSGQLLRHQAVLGARLADRVEGAHPQHAAEQPHVVGPVERPEDAPVGAVRDVADGTGREHQSGVPDPLHKPR